MEENYNEQKKNIINKNIFLDYKIYIIGIIFFLIDFGILYFEEFFKSTFIIENIFYLILPLNTLGIYIYSIINEYKLKKKKSFKRKNKILSTLFLSFLLFVIFWDFKLFQIFINKNGKFILSEFLIYMAFFALNTVFIEFMFIWGKLKEKNSHIEYIFDTTIIVLTVIFILGTLLRKEIFTYIEPFLKGILLPIRTILLVFFLAVFVLFLTNLYNTLKRKNEENDKIKKTKIISIVSFVVVLFLMFLNVKVFSILDYKLAFDCTENKIYTFSNEEKEKLKNVKEEKYLYSYKEDINPEELFVLAKMQKLNKKINIITKNNLFNKILVRENIAKEKMKMTEKEVLKISKDEIKQMKSVIYVYNKETINPKVIFLREYSEQIPNGKISNTIVKDIIEPVISFDINKDEKQKKIVIYGKNSGFNQESFVDVIKDLRYQGFEVKILNDLTNVEKDVSSILFIGPMKDISNQEKEGVKAYIKQGGNIALLYQNLEKADENQMNNYNELLNEFGIRIESCQLLEISNNYRHVYFEKAKKEQAKKELLEKYNKKTTTKEYLDAQAKIDNLDYSVDNTILYNEFSNESNITSKLYKEGFRFISINPATVLYNEKKIESEKIEKDVFITTSDGAIFNKKFNSEIVNSKNLSIDTFKEKSTRAGRFTIGAMLTKKVGDKNSRCLVFTSAAPFLNEKISLISTKEDIYSLEGNREVFLNAINKLNNNEKYIKDKKYSKATEFTLNKFNIIYMVVNVICLSGLIYISLRTKFKNKQTNN